MALIISRKKFESIDIYGPGPNDGPPLVVVSLVEIRGDRARIGIDCDRSLAVNRREVTNAIRSEAGHEPLVGQATELPALLAGGPELLHTCHALRSMVDDLLADRLHRETVGTLLRQYDETLADYPAPQATKTLPNDRTEAVTA